MSFQISPPFFSFRKQTWLIWELVGFYLCWRDRELKTVGVIPLFLLMKRLVTPLMYFIVKIYNLLLYKDFSQHLYNPRVLYNQQHYRTGHSINAHTHTHIEWQGASDIQNRNVKGDRRESWNEGHRIVLKSLINNQLTYYKFTYLLIYSLRDYFIFLIIKLTNLN